MKSAKSFSVLGDTCSTHAEWFACHPSITHTDVYSIFYHQQNKITTLLTTNIEASLFISYVCHSWSIDIAQMILFMLYFSPHLGSLLLLLESQTVRTVICIIHYHKNCINTHKCAKESLFITQQHHPKFVHWYENLRSHW